MHGGGVEELRLALWLAFVNVDTQQLTVVGGGEGAEAEHFTSPIAQSLRWKSFHHGHILGIGQVAIPAIGTLSVPHGDGSQRRRSLQNGLQAKAQQLVVFLLVGVTNDVTSIESVHRAKFAEILYPGKVILAEGKVILTALTHKCPQITLSKRSRSHDEKE